METLKETIKNLSKKQTLLKDQRKSVYNKLTRTIEPWKAQMQHIENRQTLREYYAAYSILKGVSIEEVKLNYGKDIPYNWNNFKYRLDAINKVVEEHKSEFIREETIHTC